MASEEHRRGRLLVFLGAAPGVGKTTAMLREGTRLASEGTDVVVGLVDLHGRTGGEANAEGLERVALHGVAYRDAWFEELDVDAVLHRAPQLVLVDELAHSNVIGSRHNKRWQDIEELLASGIGVITSLNVSHLDSLNDQVEAITGVAQHETVPDGVVTAAEWVEFVDESPDTLRNRLASGSLLTGEAAESVLRGYYRADRLAALRQLALEWLAAQGIRSRPGDQPRDQAHVIAALTPAPEGRHVLRRAAHIAGDAGGSFSGVHVREPSGLAGATPGWLAEQRRLLTELGGAYREIAGVDVARALLDVCRSEKAQHLVLGASHRRRRDQVLHGSVIERALRRAGDVEVNVVPLPSVSVDPFGSGSPATKGPSRVPLPPRRRHLAWALSVIMPLAAAGVLFPVRSSVGVAGALFAALLGVVAVAAIGGVRPGMVATAVGFLSADFLFTVPYYSLRVNRAIDIIALVAFVVVAAVVGTLVDVLTRQGVHVAGGRAEAEGLARLAAESLDTDASEFDNIAATLRSTFDLDSVTVLHRVGERWRPDFALGEPVLLRPDETELSAELGDGRVMVLSARPSAVRDTQLLEIFVETLRLRRQRDQLARLSHPAQGQIGRHAAR
jgi:two-component system sensor histidine kinase KdpD